MDSVQEQVLENQSNLTQDGLNQQPITLDMVKWDSRFKLSRASIGQIMKSFMNILNTKEKNVYEETLYKIIKPEIKLMLDHYNKLLEYHNIFDFNVKYYNLIVNMPGNVSVQEEDHGKVFLGNPKIGKLIQAAKQRTEFIINREVPMVCKSDPGIHIEFVKLQQNMVEFRETIINFEKKFIQAIDKAHKKQQSFYGTNKKH